MSAGERKSKGNRSSSNIVRDGPQDFRFELGERLRWLLDRFDTRNDAAKVAAVTPEHLASYISGRTKPPFELVARLARAQDVSLDWLATGEGERLAADAEPDGYLAVPVQADADSRFDEAPALLFSRAWLHTAITAPEDGLRVVIHRGNANEPAIRDGDAMLVDTTAQRIDEDALYVFVRNGRHQARFVETFIDGRVALKSRNPDYGMQVLSREDAGRLQVFGRVRWRGGAI
jgi:transcriptional regulator with XRE-family HTH domain